MIFILCIACKLWPSSVHEQTDKQTDGHTPILCKWGIENVLETFYNSYCITESPTWKKSLGEQKEKLPLQSKTLNSVKCCSPIFKPLEVVHESTMCLSFKFCEVFFVEIQELVSCESKPCQ